MQVVLIVLIALTFTIQAKAGNGVFGLAKGSYTGAGAVVMNGELELIETWLPTTSGFKVIKASQNFKGLKSTYEATFKRN